MLRRHHRAHLLRLALSGLQPGDIADHAAEVKQQLWSAESDEVRVVSGGRSAGDGRGGEEPPEAVRKGRHGLRRRFTLQTQV
jgi:hypothetical protein